MSFTCSSGIYPPGRTFAYLSLTVRSWFPSNRFPVWVAPWTPSTFTPSQAQKSPSSRLTTRGARSLNAGSILLAHRSMGSMTWLSAEMTL